MKRFIFAITVLMIFAASLNTSATDEKLTLTVNSNSEIVPGEFISIKIHGGDRIKAYPGYNFVSWATEGSSPFSKPVNTDIDVVSVVWPSLYRNKLSIYALRVLEIDGFCHGYKLRTDYRGRLSYKPVIVYHSTSENHWTRATELQAVYVHVIVVDGASTAAFQTIRISRNKASVSAAPAISTSKSIKEHKLVKNLLGAVPINKIKTWGAIKTQ